MDRMEYMRERYALDAAYEAAAEAKEKEQRRITQLQDNIEAAMEEITEDREAVLTYNEYMDELSFYFDDRDYEYQEVFIKQIIANLKEREQE